MASVPRVLLFFALSLFVCRAQESSHTGDSESLAPSPAAKAALLEGKNSGDGLKKETLAARVENLVKEEFAGDVREAEKHIGTEYHNSANSATASMETVVHVSHKRRENVTSAEAGEGTATSKNQTGTTKSHEMESDVDRMIDSRDNEYVLSKPKELAALTLDPVFIQDLTILYTSAAGLGLLFESLGQPVINGYFVAGSIVGTGGFMLIKELVQVQSLAQLGVQLLLFHLGLEFSLSKMQAVGGVAFFGGGMQMAAFVVIIVMGCTIAGADAKIGAFIGAFLSLSSTSVVANCLESSKMTNSQYGQITIATLIAQDCTVGIMFAFMPLIGTQQDKPLDANSESPVFPLLLSLVVKLLTLVVVGTFVSRTLLPPAVRCATVLFSRDLFQILLLAYCCLCALLTGWIGLSHELGAFVAGCMLAPSPLAPNAVQSIEGARNIFMTLFMASIGLMLSPAFLWEHIAILTCSVTAVILCKAAVIACIVRLFNIDIRTALMIGLSLAQISEFAFVLLSMAVDFGLLKVEMYLLLIGVTGLSLLCTPILISVSRRALLPDGSSKRSSGEGDAELRLVTTEQLNASRNYRRRQAELKS